MKKVLILLLIMCIILVSVTGCKMAGNNYYENTKKANFLDGIWYGWIAPIALIGTLFNDKIKIYEPDNDGFAYDLGYYIAIVGGFGGIAFFEAKTVKTINFLQEI